MLAAPLAYEKYLENVAESLVSNKPITDFDFFSRKRQNTIQFSST